MDTIDTPFWRRRRYQILFAIALLPLLSLFILTRPFVLSPIIAQALEDELGVQIEVQGARIHLGGVITLDEICIVAHNLDGPASNVVTIKDVEILFSSPLPIFDPVIVGVEVNSVTLRLAESSEKAGEFNFSNILRSETLSKEESSTSEQETTAHRNLPPIDIDELVIETGYMYGDTWTLDYSKVFTLTGVVQEGSKTTLQLVDTDEELNIALELTSSPMALHAEIDDVDLADSIFNLLPRTARTWCDESGLRGRFTSLQVSWGKEIGFIVTADINQIRFNLPQEHGVPFAAYRDGVVKRIRGDAILDVNSGSIEYDGQEVVLNNIKGSIIPPMQELSEPLEFSGALRIYEFDSVGAKEGKDWMSSMLSDAPFKAIFKIEDFSPSEARPGEVRVPLAAAQMLKIFELEHWNMNAKVSVSRTEFKGEIEVQGELAINASEGKYAEFPYPLKNLQSHIKFRQNEIQIIELRADGSKNASILIKGNIYASTEDLIVELKLYAGNAPIDSALRDAVSDQLATVMDNLIDQEAYEQIVNSIGDPRETPFELGGLIDLELLIKHDSRQDSGVELTGEIAIKDIGILHKDFPYPVVLRSGVVTLDKDGLHVLEDSAVSFEGYGGGRGFLVGSIRFLDNGTAAPVLALGLKGEQVTSALIGAVIDSAGEDNKLAADILSGLGLTSMLDMSGNVVGTAEGDINTSFKINLIEGSSKPNKQLATAMNVTGPFWPDGFEFTGIEAELSIKNGVVDMQGATCQCGDGSVQISMSIDKGEFDISVIGEELPLSPQFVEVLPKSTSSKLSSSWRWLNPTGLMDAIIRMKKRGDESTLNMTIEPKQLLVTGENSTTVMNLTSGTIQVEGTNIFLNELQFQLSEGGVRQGEIDISGEVLGSSENVEYSISANWDGAVIGSPFARAITGIVGDVKGVEFYDSIALDGLAKATLQASGNSDGMQYNIDVAPESLTATFHNRQASAVFDVANGPAKNVIHFNNDGIHFDHLVGQLGEGDISIDGKITSDSIVDGKFDMTWNGPTGDESLFAILPSVVGDTLLEINMHGGLSTIPNGEVSFKGDDWDELSVHFIGDITKQDVSIDVGIALDHIQGVTHIEGEYSKEKLSTFELSMAFDELTTLGRKVTDVIGSLEYEPKTQRFIFNEVRGESVTGGVTVEGWLGLGDSKEYELEILIAGVDLASSEGDKFVASLEGELKGWISIAGVHGDSDSRRGMGKIIVENGRLEIDPFSLTTMRVLQLALPSASTIEGAKIDLYIRGDQIILEDISLHSNENDLSDFVLEGTGTIDFETTEIRARLHPRAGLPILRDIAGALNDQFYSIDVTGKLLSPEVSVVPLPFLSPHDE